MGLEESDDDLEEIVDVGREIVGCVDSIDEGLEDCDDDMEEIEEIDDVGDTIVGCVDVDLATSKFDDVILGMSVGVIDGDDTFVCGS